MADLVFDVVVDQDVEITVVEDAVVDLSAVDSGDVTVVEVIGPAGATGPAGAAATVSVGTVTTGSPGSSAVVSNAGTASSAVFNFTIPAGVAGSAGATGPAGPTGPAGAAGAAGVAATVSVGTVTTGAPSDPAAVTNVGTSNAAVLNFTIPKGDTGATGAAGSAGEAGAAATVSVGTVITGSAGSSATVTNAGTSNAAILNFSIPKGDTGATGSAATVAVGTVTTGAAGSSATVTNAGTSSAAVLNFSIPRGDTGATGAAGATGPAGTTSWLGLTDVPTNLAYTDTTQTFTNKSFSGTTKIPTTGVLESYNTANQSTDWEKTVFRWNANSAEIANLFAGTGTLSRPITIGVSTGAGNNTAGRSLTIQNAVPFISCTSGGSGNSSTASGGAHIRWGSTSTQFTASSLHQTVCSVAGNIGQSGTASYTGLLVDITETSVGSGTKYLINAQVGGASKFLVDNSGGVQINGNPALSKVSVPATSTSSGIVGQVAYNGSYLYLCVAANSWVRAAVGSW